MAIRSEEEIKRYLGDCEKEKKKPPTYNSKERIKTNNNHIYILRWVLGLDPQTGAKL